MHDIDELRIHNVYLLIITIFDSIMVLTMNHGNNKIISLIIISMLCLSFCAYLNLANLVSASPSARTITVYDTRTGLTASGDDSLNGSLSGYEGDHLHISGTVSDEYTDWRLWLDDHEFNLYRVIATKDSDMPRIFSDIQYNIPSPTINGTYYIDLWIYANGTWYQPSQCYVEFVVIQAANPVVAFATNGMSSDASGTVLTIDGTSYTYDQIQSLAFLNWPAGSTHTVTATSPVTATSTKRYAFSSWTNGNGLTTASGTFTTPSSSTTVTVNYDTQYKVTFTASGGNLLTDGSGTIVTVGGNAKTRDNLPYEPWITSGFMITWAYSSPVASTSDPTGTSYVWSSTSGLGQSGQSGVLTANAGGTVTATYIQNTTVSDYTLTMYTVGSGTVSPGNHTYAAGTPVNLVAIPAAGWSFSGWSGATTGTTNTSITMDSNKTVTATFTQDTYTLTMITAGQGTVSPENHTYLSGTAVNIEAVNSAGWFFAGWSGAATGTANTTVTMTGDLTVTATFTQNSYILTMLTVGQGTVLPGNGSTYSYGDSVDLKAINAAGWTFSGWTGAVSGTTNTTITMTGNLTVTATFTQDTYSLTIYTVDQGTVSPGNSTHLSGAGVDLVAISASGWHFSGWSGAATGTANTTLIMDGNKIVTATFTQDTYTLTMLTVGQGMVSPSNQSYLSGTLVPLFAVKSAGWSFDGWTGDATGTSNTTIMMSGNKTVTATFTQNTYALTMITVGQGTVSPGNHTYLSGTVVNLEAFSALDWGFSHWGGDSSGSSNTTLIMNGNKVVTATFTQTQYVVTFHQAGTAGDYTGAVLNVDGTDYTIADLPVSFTWYSGSTHTFQYMPQLGVDSGKQYMWSSTTGLSTLQAASIIVTETGTITGSYAVQYYLTVNSDHGTTSGSGWYSANAIAYAGVDSGTIAGSTGTRYVFLAWSGDSSGTDFTQSDAVVMDSAKTVTATWKTQYYLTVTSAQGSPTGEGWYDSGAAATFGIDAIVSGSSSERYLLTSWIGTGSNSYSGTAASNTITMNNPVTETAQWQAQYQVTFNVNPAESGTISSPSVDGWFDAGTVELTTSPASGYVFSSWTTSGAVTVTSATAATTTATITGPGTLTANFNAVSLPAEFSITVSGGSREGLITPSGALNIAYGGSQTFTITPNSGYHIADVQVDGVSVGAVTSYTFSNITSSHTITATFAVNTYTITVVSSHGSPTSSTQVNYGGSFTAQVTSPVSIDETHQWVCTGYSVDGGSSVNATSYTFSSVTSDHTIVFNWQVIIIITPNIVTEVSNGTSSNSGTPFIFEIAGNITATQIANPTMIVDEAANTVTLSMNLTGPSGTTGFCNMTIPKSTMPSGVIPTPIVYIDGVIAEQQGYTQDADNFYVWYSTHFSNHQVEVVFPASAPATPSPTPENTPKPQFAADMFPSISVAAAIAIIALVLIGLVARRRKKKQDAEA